MSIRNFLQALRSAEAVDVVNHTFPELSGRRAVVKVQTNGFALRLPESHPRYTPDHGGSWTYFGQGYDMSVVGSTLVVKSEGYHAEFTVVAS